VKRPHLTEFERGVLIGLLIGEGAFGGDGRAPQLVLKMHVRHEPLLRWLHGLFPRSRLYGPYHYDGRHFFQWMARGRCLREDVLPHLEGLEELDPHVGGRIATMRAKYPRAFGDHAADKATAS
jgi:hypothetical protein